MLYNYEVKEIEMVGKCSTNGENITYRILWEARRKEAI
jgi:hypothetical protein